jgi:hypothetical protein
VLPCRPMLVVVSACVVVVSACVVVLTAKVDTGASVVVLEGGSEVDVDVLVDVVLGVGPGSDGGMLVVVVVDVVLVVVEVVVVEVVVVVQKVVVVGSLQPLTVWSGTLLTTAPFADQPSQFCEPCPPPAPAGTASATADTVMTAATRPTRPARPRMIPKMRFMTFPPARQPPGAAGLLTDIGVRSA